MFYVDEDENYNQNGDQEIDQQSPVNSDQILAQKLQRMKLAAQRSRPRSAVGMVMSSQPLSSRGSKQTPRGSALSPTTPSSSTSIPTPTHYFNGGMDGSFRRMSITSDTGSVVSDSDSATPRFATLQQQYTFEGFGKPAQKKDREQEAMEAHLKAKGITPSFDPNPQRPLTARVDPSPEPILDLTNKRYFLTNPTNVQYGMVECYITRESNQGIKTVGKMFPRFHMYLEKDNVYLCSARKRKKNKSANYLMSLDKNDLNRNSENFFAKLRSNFVGTEFVMYDDGENPTRMQPGKVAREEHGAIKYDINILGSKGPRKMVVIIPRLTRDDERVPLQPMTEESICLSNYKKGNIDDFYVLENKSPVWSDELNAFVLNFNGRVTMASVKNFQLVDRDFPHKVLLQFGKVGENRFTLDFRYPLSPMQAFAIALSAFDHKLACE